MATISNKYSGGYAYTKDSGSTNLESGVVNPDGKTINFTNVGAAGKGRIIPDYVLELMENQSSGETGFEAPVTGQLFPFLY